MHASPLRARPHGSCERVANTTHLLATLVACATFALGGCASSGGTGSGTSSGAAGGDASEPATTGREETATDTTESTGSNDAFAPLPGEGTEEPIPHERRATSPIPVPLPAIPRDQLSAELQALWDRTEESVAHDLVPPPESAEPEVYAEWQRTVLREWVAGRMQALGRVDEAAAPLQAGTVEYGVGGGLVGYAYEDFVAALRSSPLPRHIEEDRELFAVYWSALSEQTALIARRSTAGYGACARTFAELGAESPWVEWGRYCLARSVEVTEVYGVSAP